MNYRESPYPAIILILGIFVSFYYNLGSVALFNLDEGAFGEATREMVDSGNYLTTYLNGALRFDKPILIYWLQALSLHIFGLGEFALRLPSALSATLWVVALYKFTKIHYDKELAFISAFMMATALQITIIAKASIADALLNLLIASSMFLFYRYYTHREKLHLYLLFLLIALGVLTKGPVAILIPLVVTFIFLAIKGELKVWISMVFNPIGIVIFLAVAMPWYILEYLDQGDRFINGFFFKHNLNRFNTSLEGHSGTLFYFIPVVLVGLIPYTTLVIRAIRDIKLWFRDDLTLFLIVWFGFVFIFFSLSGTKLPHYVIYGYTPLFILMALSIDKIRSDIMLLLPPVILFVILLLLPHIVPLVEPYIKKPFVQAMVSSGIDEFGWWWSLFFVILISFYIWLMVSDKFSRRYKLFIVGITTMIAINGVVMPTYAAITQEPIKEAALIAKDRGYDIYLWEFNVPTFMVYREQLTHRERPKRGDIVVTKIDKLKSFESYDILYLKHGVVMAEIK
ncbi:4-amino-4-deoxy-L-arabinose transferase and related glycosyltransferases of PMT family [hydrothermal vent metagenome]|uniref:4-amino-4-deoxy-L-arabinose transferase and related glycosyltransferases of PMT family n=1 Tax=hydrothermal vent metagenome TaxID=652676 RepID=A0A1W1BXY5_9ZZZZ